MPELVRARWTIAAFADFPRVERAVSLSSRPAVHPIEFGHCAVDVIEIEIDDALHQAQGDIKGHYVNALAQPPIAEVEPDHPRDVPLAPHCEDLELEAWLPGTGFPNGLHEPREGLSIKSGKLGPRRRSS